jgi:3-hydroxybutyryl-CoA dehydrogenase
MKFVVLADDEQWAILQATNLSAEWKRVADINAFLKATDADAYFNLHANSSDEDYRNLNGIIFINSVTKTISQINANQNTIRINAWQGFLEKEIWEIAGTITPDIAAILKVLGKKYITVDDAPGFVSARIIAMIINEAYFAKGENVSSEANIDVAMKLGTNYPFGPFEWSKKIGLKNVHNLLTCLAIEDERYLPAALLQNEIN